MWENEVSERYSMEKSLWDAEKTFYTTEYEAFERMKAPLMMPLIVFLLMFFFIFPIIQEVSGEGMGGSYLCMYIPTAMFAAVLIPLFCHLRNKYGKKLVIKDEGLAVYDVHDNLEKVLDWHLVDKLKGEMGRYDRVITTIYFFSEEKYRFRENQMVIEEICKHVPHLDAQSYFFETNERMRWNKELIAILFIASVVITLFMEYGSFFIGF